ncbi:MAG: molybdopterin-guanine dinucleotide biosynthesis protein A [Myxococcota bacterium]|jgi:molybdopterin-guanine dinucleotide biosynthesis protein A
MTQAALILCGGFSERMGRDKAGLMFGDEPLLARIVRVVMPCVDEVWLVAREGQELAVNESLGLPIARDPEEGLGPLAGVAAGLRAMKAERAFVVSCDVPLLEARLVRGLLKLSVGYRAAIPLIDGHYMSTCAVYAKSLVPEIESMLRSGERRPRQIMQLSQTCSIGVEAIEELDPQHNSFVDCNTPESYREALVLAGLSEHS